MVWFPDMVPFPGLNGDVRAIGWLEAGHPFAQGLVPPEVLSRLRQFQAGNCGELLRLAGGLGVHDCEFCPPITPGPIDPDRLGRGYIGVPQGRILFIAPQMLPHYIDKHGYAPPEEFISAVMESSLPGTEGYSAAVLPFLSNPVARSATKPPLLENISSDLKQAMKARDMLRVSVLRLILSEVSNQHIQMDPGHLLSDDDVREVLRRMVATSIESVGEFRQGQRLDMAEKETFEVAILREYLAQPSE